MYRLALETSGRSGSVALARDETVLGVRDYPPGMKHASALVSLIDELTSEHGIGPADIGEIALSIGPGSFTGLRVGVTLAKALSFAAGTKIVAVPSTRVVVENAPPDARTVVVVLDAKRGQVFTATFERADEGDAWREMKPARLARLGDVLAATPGRVHVIGEGIPYHADEIPAGVIVCAESTWIPKATAVTRIAATLSARGEYTDALKLTPIYIRLAEAEEKRLIAQGVSPANAVQ